MGTLIQRKGRSGWYLCIATPRKLWGRFGGSVIRKVGKTHREALQNRAKVEYEVDQLFRAELGQLDLASSYAAKLDTPLKDLDQDTKELLIDVATQVDKADESQLESLHRAMNGEESWEVWIQRRELQEQRRKSTVGIWRTRLKKLSTWAKRQHLQGLTKQDAVLYKDHLLMSGMQPSSVRSELGTLGSFWTWAKLHGQVSQNIFEGLKRGLPDSEKVDLPSPDVFAAALAKAIKGKDYRFLIMWHTGCRSSEANGLRHCDIDLKKGLIHFRHWKKGNMSRYLKGKKKDERSVPISVGLREQLKELELNESDDPIWPNAFKPSDESWGAGWSGSFRKKFGCGSHDLRRRALTKFALGNLSPYIVFEITRHKVQGSSAVVSQYVRPTVEEVREAMELLA